ncbi:hypothetical protein [Yoonia vestfoldensis]|jgi:uncharacterized membrane protein YphA (DoxX/SURF4 family)|uniref:hypothetical protein n=1 Tax=Yoonia vestfoldensis TaxID=245188 RepID=UPI000366B0E2|nr:hypothetical protein [Yoonia vestfoldensis]
MTQPAFLVALRAALTVAFLYFGLRKLTGYSTDVAIYEAIGFGQFPRYVTGSVEVLGACLLWWRGWEGIAGLLLLVTMIIGLSALLIWVGPPYLHMLVLMAGTGTIAYAYRDQTKRKIAQLQGG